MNLEKQKDSFLQLALISICLSFVFYSFHLLEFNSKSFFPSQFHFFSSAEKTSMQSLKVLPESLSGASRLVLGQKININTASISDLEALPVIGKKLAEEIVKNRQEKGKFVKTEDLMRVKGIKEKKFEKIKNYLEVR